ncbi:hypothetical protein [Mesorhizobium sp. M00.F.Ca.ET.216.01.1.1]|uniref:hypothetical protein n=1 Tax=Mesorhizobium sp. M00.F.Ca.ET.216.01.1.1 TaxID=2500528 RepID=UPI000FD7D79E|nr:hypothetical protein [Mesorhizobium sp. M00.F.Ca.ET.216.01.1.1]TGQ29086.1 hypothetical protein EN859_033535 [Mesorhizobium sp. M00.F.Ca.ET.216.01.1.1]
MAEVELFVDPSAEAIVAEQSLDVQQLPMTWVNISPLPVILDAFVRDVNGFSTSKNVARDLSSTISSWITQYLMTADSPP